MSRLAFDPALPWALIAALAALALAAAALARARGLRGWAWRGAAGLAVALALAGPALEMAERRGLADIVLLVEDRSASQALPGRAAQTDAAARAVTEALAGQPGVELRRVTVGDAPDGTRLGAALAQALAAEPEARLAGAILLTDGRLVDPALLPQGAPAPVHVLLTGAPGDWDRRLVIEEAPAFGLIGRPVEIRLRVADEGAVPPAMQGRPAVLRVTGDDGETQAVALPPGVTVTLPVAPAHAGANVVALSLDPPDGAGPAQLTDRNDAAALTITGVRDRLRVLLVSGEPHPGERTWRNLLKSDAAVDLIHFTILRPPDKADAVPIEEVALIPFPTRELFLERIEDFDLIIFDRYRERGILPPDYYDSIRAYVEGGGAVMISAGPEAASVEGLGMTALEAVLPADASGRVIDAPFTPRLTEAGRRHPVTGALPGAPPPGAAADARPAWGRWLRRIELLPRPGAEVVMTADAGEPLVVLGRAGRGRVVLIGSDQVWLWGRGFEGGGPQLELLRRVAHWAMSEPDLEEEALTAAATGDLGLAVTRRTLGETVPPVSLAGPGGRTAQLVLAPVAPGRFAAEWTAPVPGLWRLTQGELTRLVALGPAAPREFAGTVADGAALAPLAEATGGAVLKLSDGMPALRRVAAGRPTTGRGVGAAWIGLPRRGAETVTGRRLQPLLPPWGWLALTAGLALAAWLAEGGAQPRRRPQVATRQR